MKRQLSRRELMKAVLSASAFVAALDLTGKNLRAADLTSLDPTDPTAKALGFVPDASKIDASANSTFKSGSQCAGCAQFQGKPGDTTGGCTIFAGRAVPATGWCSAWTKRG